MRAFVEILTFALEYCHTAERVINNTAFALMQKQSYGVMNEQCAASFSFYIVKGKG